MRCGNSVGFDFGLKTYLKASNGNDIESPMFFKQGQDKIKKLNRVLSCKKKGSNNRRKARLNLAREHKRIANRRKDFQFKLAYDLCEKYATICLETLDLAAMKDRWGKQISDLSHSGFVKILEYTAFKCGTQVIKIDKWYPSSKTCSNCEYICKDLELGMREWQCPECKAIHDRDLNAALNIHRVGTSTLRLDTVSPASVG